jgi:hypothetical protein
LHFEMPEYLKASVNYDSVIKFVPADYSGFEQIQSRQKILFNLAKHLRVIEREDSLQRLASMTPAERNKIVDAIIRDFREKERIEREAEMERMRQMQQMAGREATNRAASRSTDGGASWYFYNTSTINFGKTEFYAKWGSRELEDLWRISNKQVIAFGEDMEEMDAEGEAEQASDKYNRQSYLDNIPLTSEKLELSNKLLAEAFYNIGIILKNDIKDEENALKSFNTLISRFIDFDKKLNTYYYLYAINDELGNKSEAEDFKNRIIREFPESDYAKILKDPNYAENIRKRKNAAEILYNESYNAFLVGNYDVVISNFNKLDTADTEDNLIARFIYLKAVSYGKKEMTEEMKVNLESIVLNYKETNSFIPAQNLLNLIAQTSSIAEKDIKDSAIKEEVISLYNYTPLSVHFFALVIDSKKIQLREVRNVLNRFNRENFKDNNLTISNIFLNDKQQLLTITNFQSADKAMDYYGKLFEGKILDSYDFADYEAFLISVENYPIFYQDKNLEEYLKFYRYYYFQ